VRTRQRLAALAVAGSALLALCGEAAAQDDKRFENSVLRITASTQAVDRTAPWQFEEVSTQTNLAVVLDDGVILTSAFAVADATLIEGQKFGSSRKTELEVAFVDYEVNLALLKPAAGATLEGLNPVTLGVFLYVL
jgi:hypothetical protein